jgi:hypothetical protein
MLRTTLAVLLVGATAFSAPAAHRDASDEERIAKQLVDLTPGEPRSCVVPSRSAGGTHAGNAVLVKDRSNTLYLAHFEGGCEARESDALISRRFSAQLCRGDLVEIRDLSSGISRGTCS